uniref:ABC transporter permease n=1 Tax=Candidatus Enterococcus willemsii TaxID=1857215 RepID=UPI00403F9BB8
MRIYVNWRTSIRSVFKNRKRSLLTMFGIIIGIAAVIAILSIGRGFEKDTLKNLSNTDDELVEIQVSFTPNNGSVDGNNLNFFHDTDRTQVEQIEGVQSAEYPVQDETLIFKDIFIGEKKESKQLSLVEETTKELILGRGLTKFDNEIKNNLAVIDSVTATQLYDTEEQALGKGIEIEGYLFKIIGIYQGIERENMFALPETNIELPPNVYTRYFTTQESSAALIITLEENAIPATVTTEVITLLEEKGTMKEFGEYVVFDTALLTDGISQILRTITLFISCVAGISLVIAGVGVMNMMYISVSERTKEIGIRRALGATQQAIRLQFLLEGVTLTVVGGLIGYVLGIGFAYLIGSFIDVTVSIDLFTILLAVGISSGIGILFSVMPASEAAKKDLIDILR